MNHIEKSKDPHASLDELRKLFVDHPDLVFLNPIFELLLIETPSLMGSIPASLLADTIEHHFCPYSALSYVAQMSAEVLQLAVLKNPGTTKNVAKFLEVWGRTVRVRSSATIFKEAEEPWIRTNDIAEVKYWGAYIDTIKTVEDINELLNRSNLPSGITQLALFKLAGRSDSLGRKARVAIAKNPKTSPIILEYLSKGGVKAVRDAAACNRNKEKCLHQISNDNGISIALEESNGSSNVAVLSTASLRHWCRTRSKFHWNLFYKDPLFDNELMVFLARSPEIDSITVGLLVGKHDWMAIDVEAALAINPAVDTASLIMLSDKTGENRYYHHNSNYDNIDSHEKELIKRLIKVRLYGLPKAIQEWKKQDIKIIEDYTKVSFDCYAQENPGILSIYYDKDLLQSIDDAIKGVHDGRYGIDSGRFAYGENEFEQVGGHLHYERDLVMKACSIMFSDWDDLFSNYGHVIQDNNYDYPIQEWLALYFLSLFPLNTKESRDLFVTNLAALALFTRYDWLQHHVPYPL